MKFLDTIEAPERLGYGEALSSPCATCATSPCCTYLPLHTFKVTNMLELNHAVYLLNFSRIELGLSATGEWSVYYRYSCRFLNKKDFSCNIHDTPQQPNICVNYSPYSCWYKRVFTNDVTEEFLRIDQRRMDYILQHVVFDESRNIVEVPAWESLVEEFAKLPLIPNEELADTPEVQELAVEGWKEDSAYLGNSSNSNGKTYGYDDEVLDNPCVGCQAYCCKNLVFPKPTPTDKSGLDFLQFCLGFPGIEVGISDNGWSLIVKTTCRHLKGNLCSVYGKSERPLICKYYDSWTCTYKPEFGLPRPAGYVRVGLEQYRLLLKGLEFDDSGTVTQMPSADGVRELIEEMKLQSGSTDAHPDGSSSQGDIQQPLVVSRK